MRQKHASKTWARQLFDAGTVKAFGRIRREERRRSRHLYNRFYRDLEGYGSNFKLDEDLESVFHFENFDEPTIKRRERKNEYLDDYLAPLQGFLRSNVGRPWTEVYGKLVRRTDRNSVCGDHLWLHVDGYVETDPRLIEREQNQFVIGRRYYNNSYYVDEDGILQYLIPQVEPPEGYGPNGKRKSQIREKQAKEWAGVKIVENSVGPERYRYLYPPTEIMLRKVLVQGTKLYWCHWKERYRQSRELSKEEYHFYNRCDDWAKKAITHNPK